MRPHLALAWLLFFLPAAPSLLQEVQAAEDRGCQGSSSKLTIDNFALLAILNAIESLSTMPGGQGIVADQIAGLKSALKTLEQQLAAGKVRTGLEEFKDAIDRTRVSIWAILTSSRPAEFDTVLLRLRLRRAGELCQNIDSDIKRGIPIAPSEVHRFQTTLRTTLDRLEQLVEAKHGAGPAS